MRDAALRYAGWGWPVFPLQAPTVGDPETGKRPLVARGLHEATTDPEQIRRWWARWPDANVGVATGSRLGAWVLDVDGEAGARSLAELEAEIGPLPATLEAETGGGGRHFFFRMPDGREITNRKGVRPGLDVRGQGGYVVAAPSAHWSGGSYSWATDETEAMAAAPSAWVDLVAPRARPATSARRTAERGASDCTRTPRRARELPAVAAWLGGIAEERNRTALAVNGGLRWLGASEADRLGVLSDMLSACRATTNEGHEEALRIVVSGERRAASGQPLATLGSLRRLVGDDRFGSFVDAARADGLLTARRIGDDVELRAAYAGSSKRVQERFKRSASCGRHAAHRLYSSARHGGTRGIWTRTACGARTCPHCGESQASALLELTSWPETVYAVALAFPGAVELDQAAAAISRGLRSRHGDYARFVSWHEDGRPLLFVAFTDKRDAQRLDCGDVVWKTEDGVEAVAKLADLVRSWSARTARILKGASLTEEPTTLRSSTGALAIPTDQSIDHLLRSRAEARRAAALTRKHGGRRWRFVGIRRHAPWSAVKAGERIAAAWRRQAGLRQRLDSRAAP